MIISGILVDSVQHQEGNWIIRIDDSACGYVEIYDRLDGVGGLLGGGFHLWMLPLQLRPVKKKSSLRRDPRN